MKALLLILVIKKKDVIFFRIHIINNQIALTLYNQMLQPSDSQ